MADLATWLVDDVKWEKGAPSVWERQCPTPPPSPPEPTEGEAGEGGTNVVGVLDMRDVIKEKQAMGMNFENVVIMKSELCVNKLHRTQLNSNFSYKVLLPVWLIKLLHMYITCILIQVMQWRMVHPTSWS